MARRLPLTAEQRTERRREQTRLRAHRYRARKKQRDVTLTVRTYDDLIGALRDQRRKLGISQLELDDLAGWSSGYSGKLELGYRKGGRGIGKLLPAWLRALGVQLAVIVPAGVEHDDATH